MIHSGNDYNKRKYFDFQVRIILKEMFVLVQLHLGHYKRLNSTGQIYTWEINYNQILTSLCLSILPPYSKNKKQNLSNKVFPSLNKATQPTLRKLIHIMLAVSSEVWNAHI